jgi:2OG-Fe(II) oxygenase superfamily
MLKSLLTLFILLNFYCFSDTEKEYPYHIAKCPESMQKLFENATTYFHNKEIIKPHDNRFFNKWYQLQKLWSKDKNEGGHYERKESIVITNENNNFEEMKICRRELIQFSIEHLENIEKKYEIPSHLLTMESSDNPTHTLRILHYLDDSGATAHTDTSIMTCLYYRDPGLELKIDGKWIKAPILKKNEMLVTYGVPGEIISNGHLPSVRHRVKCDERYAVAYFHNTPKEYEMQSEDYSSTTMAKVYQEAQLWYADVNARTVRKHWETTDLPWYAIIYGWISQRFVTFNENLVAKKGF